MKKLAVNGLTLYFSEEDQDAVALIQQASEKSMRLIKKHYGLETPHDCCLYIMTSWLGFMFHSAPWSWKALLAASLPLWAIRARKIWSLAGGWELSFGQRRVVGVKPPRLLMLADKRIGERLFVELENLDEKVKSITCHELTHAFTSHLRLPMWLKEGLAMVMVDKFFNMPTVQHETIEVFERSSEKHNPGDEPKLRIGNDDALVTLYARSYWQTRFIEETQPGLLKEILSRRYQHEELERKIADAYGKRVEGFWSEASTMLVSHFMRGG